ncbi:thermonuclease family protein [Faunimonas sp. B44]|uniref:thermonuclease family protein n=1 Tax=Faunimonas sp. B44 TaxID=3461493 RepID=UPI0040442CFC
MFLFRIARTVLAALALLKLASGPSLAAETVAGPYRAAVERVVDGDTIAVRVPIWIGQEIRVLVRIRGVDAPERRARCADEKAGAEAAAAALADLVDGADVVLTGITGDKYWGRVIADVTAPDGTDIGHALLERNVARRYEGRARGGWC